MKIVYESKTGHTKKYAEMLGEELNIPVYTLKQALKELEKDEEIIFLSWIYIEKLKGLKKVKKFNLKCICAVGDAAHTEDYITFLKRRCKIDTPLFYLRGGIDLEKLNILHKLLIKLFVKILTLKKDTDKEILDTYSKSINYVSKDNLKPIIDFVI